MPGGRVIAYTFKAIDRYSRVANAINRKTSRIRQEFGSLSKAANKAGKSIQKMGQGMRKVSLAAAAVAGGSVKAFSDMESGLTNVFTLLSRDEIKKFSGQLTKASKGAVGLGFEIGDANKALFNNVSMLGASEKSLIAYDAAQKLAVGGVTDLNTSVRGIGFVMNAYKEEATDGLEIANAYFTAQRFGSTTVQELADNVGKVAPIAKIAGIGFKELLATTAQLTQGGLDTTIATTGLRAAISSLINPSKDARKYLTAMGVPWGVSQIRAAGLAGTLAKLTEAAVKYPDAINSAIPEVRAFTAVASMQGDAVNRVGMIMRTIEEDYKNGTGLMDAYAMQMNTTTHAMKIAWGQIKLAAIQMGEKLAPAVKAVAHLVAKMAAGFQNLSSAAQSVIAWATVFAASFSTILTVVGGFLIVLGKGAAVAGFIGGLFSLPVLAAVAAVVGIAAAAVAIYNHWESISDFINSGIAKVKDFFGFGGESLDVKGSATLNQNARLDVGVGVTAPKGVVTETNQSTSGDISGLNLHKTMVTEY